MLDIYLSFERTLRSDIKSESISHHCLCKYNDATNYLLSATLAIFHALVSWVNFYMSPNHFSKGTGYEIAYVHADSRCMHVPTACMTKRIYARMAILAIVYSTTGLSDEVRC